MIRKFDVYLDQILSVKTMSWTLIVVCIAVFQSIIKYFKDDSTFSFVIAKKHCRFH